MPTIRDSTIDEVEALLPPWESASEMPATNVFMGAIGFEERAVCCFEMWCRTLEGRAGIALLLNYHINLEDNDQRAKSFDRAAETAGVKVVRITYSRLSIYGEVIRVVRELPRQAHVLFDLTALASFGFYPLMAALFDEVPEWTLHVCYAEATSYFPSEDEWTRFQAKMSTLDLFRRAELFETAHFQSRGVDSVYESANFSGLNTDRVPTVLAVVPNFSRERVYQMIDRAVDLYGVDRGDAEWIIGVPPDQAKNAWRQGALWEMYEKPNNVHPASTLEYKDILRVLQDLWRETHGSRAMLVATVGSKAQHLGTFLFLEMHPDVGLMLAEPKEFTASRYSLGVGPKWLADFGEIGALRKLLKDWNRVIFNW